MARSYPATADRRPIDAAVGGTLSVLWLLTSPVIRIRSLDTDS